MLGYNLVFVSGLFIQNLRRKSITRGAGSMNRIGSLLAAVSLAAVCTVLGARQVLAQGRGHVVVPDSSVEHAQDRGVRAHTNHLLFVPEKPGPSPTASSPSGMSPASIRAAYNLPAPTTPYTGSGVIAIVDAFDYPTAQADFDTFSAQFGLPKSTDNVCNGANPCFVKVLATNGKIRSNCGWAQEAALDIEWAHAMAPYAQIILVEAKSNSFTDLFTAVDVATNLVKSGGVGSGAINKGEVSMSWGGSEFSSEASYDFHFPLNGNVVYFASSGDTGGKTIYPSASPNIVAAGGTSLRFNGTNWVETGWSGSGGGPSAYESRPGYQSGVSSIVGSARGIPDFSFDADPYTGVSVYDSTSCQGLVGWLVFGGTSVSSPSLAGIVNAAGAFNSDSNSELTIIYGGLGGSNFRDITSGTAGSYSAKTGWDFVTGVGSDLGYVGK
jgi:subtilase family serine protease